MERSNSKIFESRRGDQVMKKVSLVLAAAVLFLTPGLMAEGARHVPKGRTINKRQVRQQKRIGQGVNSGQLTANEAAKLERQQVSINQQEQRFRASGGEFTKKERAVITHRQNQASKKIYREKHDNQTQ
jgi:hypothetical protein